MKLPKPKKKPFDAILEIIGLLAILVCFLLPAIFFKQLPDSIPRHYGSDGLPDAFGGKGIIWVLPSVGLVMYFVLGLLSNTPALFNIPVKVTPENAEHYHNRYARMIRILNVGMVALFTYLTYQSIQVGLGRQSGLSSWFLPLSLLFFFGIPLIFILPDLLKAKNQN